MIILHRDRHNKCYKRKTRNFSEVERIWEGYHWNYGKVEESGNVIDFADIDFEIASFSDKLDIGFKLTAQQ